MKKYYFIAMATLILTSCTSNEGANAEERKMEYAAYVDELTEMNFEQDNYDFGTVTDGDMVKHTFKFTNTGDKNLVLFDVKTSCGCTVPEDWPKQPIKPGEGGEVKVIFNSHDKVGTIKKTIRIEANTNPSVTTVSITGTVEAAE